MTLAFVLIAASALVGMATGLVFKIWALVLIAPSIAVLSAIVLRSYQFGLGAGVATIAACLAVCQLAYLAATYLMHGRETSARDRRRARRGARA